MSRYQRNIQIPLCKRCTLNLKGKKKGRREEKILYFSNYFVRTFFNNSDYNNDCSFGDSTLPIAKVLTDKF